MAMEASARRFMSRSASAACAAQHQAPAELASMTACNSRSACAQLRDLRRHLRPERLQLRLIRGAQRGDLGVLGLDHLPQPGVRRPQRGGLIGGRRDIGHETYSITVGGA